MKTNRKKQIRIGNIIVTFILTEYLDNCQDPSPYKFSLSLILSIEILRFLNSDIAQHILITHNTKPNMFRHLVKNKLLLESQSSVILRHDQIHCVIYAC